MGAQLDGGQSLLKGFQKGQEPLGFLYLCSTSTLYLLHEFCYWKGRAPPIHIGSVGNQETQLSCMNSILKDSTQHK